PAGGEVFRDSDGLLRRLGQIVPDSERVAVLGVELSTSSRGVVSTMNTERPVLQAFAEYEDVS
ncbi:hypothetical protein PI125_g25305, partial [Phytophthora idaei]